MFWYNIKITFRNILKNKGYSIINILGLSIGMASSLLIILMVHFSLNTDKFNNNYENLFLLQQVVSFSSDDYTTDRTGGAVGPTMANAYPQIQKFTRYGQLGEMLLTYYPEDNYSIYNEPRSFVEETGIAADSTFFDVFSFEFITGNSQQALVKNNYIILTEALARKIFQDTDPMGKTILLNDEIELIVYGILSEIPNNSSIQFSFIVPFEIYGTLGYPLDSFGGTIYQTYFVLDDPTSAEIINRDINEFLDSFEEGSDREFEVHRYLAHIRDVFLFGEANAGVGIIIFGIFGLAILLIACINYINLATAKSIERAREVGIRKTGGALKWQLIKQFLTESFVLSILAIHLAVLFVELSLPKLNNTYEAQLSIQYSDPVFWFILLGMVLFITLLAGAYPAFLLSSLKPSLIFKEYTSSGSRGVKLRKFLVVFQFTITTFFILCTLFLYKQLDYVDSADLGFSKENVLYIPTRGKLRDNYTKLKDELRAESSVKYVSSASHLPNFAEHGEVDWGKGSETQNTIARILWSDFNLTRTLELEMAEGRFYSRDNASDTANGIVVNESIIKLLEYEGDPIGQRFRLWDNECTIIGVVKDYPFFPFDIGAEALIMPYRELNNFIFIKLQNTINATSLARIQTIFKKNNPDYPFEYYHLSQYKNPLTTDSEKLISILFYFCAFGVFISCMGLFGLALYTVEKRTKEIGIRKVFGASVTRIISLLSREFIMLVIIADVLAIPLSYITLKGLLKFFTVKISLDIEIFAAIAFMMITIAMVTVLWQSIRTARKNPVLSLRYE